MKYYTITCNPEEIVLISYLSRIHQPLIKRLKTRVKLYVPEDNVPDKKTFVSLCAHIPFKKITLNFGKVPFLDKINLVEYCELLFDSIAEDSDIDFSKFEKINDYVYKTK